MRSISADWNISLVRSVLQESKQFLSFSCVLRFFYKWRDLAHRYCYVVSVPLCKKKHYIIESLNRHRHPSKIQWLPLQRATADRCNCRQTCASTGGTFVWLRGAPQVEESGRTLFCNWSGRASAAGWAIFRQAKVYRVLAVYRVWKLNIQEFRRPPGESLFVYRISGGFSFSRLINDRTQIPSTFVTKNVGVPAWNKKGKQKQKHNVRTYRFLPADTTYIRIWYIIRTRYHTVVACDNNSGLPTPH